MILNDAIDDLGLNSALCKDHLLCSDFLVNERSFRKLELIVCYDALGADFLVNQGSILFFVHISSDSTSGAVLFVYERLLCLITFEVGDYGLNLLGLIVALCKRVLACLLLSEDGYCLGFVCIIDRIYELILRLTEFGLALCKEVFLLGLVSVEDLDASGNGKLFLFGLDSIIVIETRLILTVNNLSVNVSFCDNIACRATGLENLFLYDGLYYLFYGFYLIFFDHRLCITGVKLLAALLKNCVSIAGLRSICNLNNGCIFFNRLFKRSIDCIGNKLICTKRIDYLCRIASLGKNVGADRFSCIKNLCRRKSLAGFFDFGNVILSVLKSFDSLVNLSIIFLCSKLVCNRGLVSTEGVSLNGCFFLVLCTGDLLNLGAFKKHVSALASCGSDHLIGGRNGLRLFCLYDFVVRFNLFVLTCNRLRARLVNIDYLFSCLCLLCGSCFYGSSIEYLYSNICIGGLCLFRLFYHRSIKNCNFVALVSNLHAFFKVKDLLTDDSYCACILGDDVCITGLSCLLSLISGNYSCGAVKLFYGLGGFHYLGHLGLRCYCDLVCYGSCNYLSFGRLGNYGALACDNYHGGHILGNSGLLCYLVYNDSIRYGSGLLRLYRACLVDCGKLSVAIVNCRLFIRYVFDS